MTQQNQNTTAARIAGGKLGAALVNQGAPTIALPTVSIETPDDVRAIAAAVMVSVASGRCTSAQAEAVLKAARLAFDVILDDQQSTIDRLVQELDRILPGGR
jgi:hypothetical protein